MRFDKLLFPGGILVEQKDKRHILIVNVFLGHRRKCTCDYHIWRKDVAFFTSSSKLVFFLYYKKFIIV